MRRFIILLLFIVGILNSCTKSEFDRQSSKEGMSWPDDSIVDKIVLNTLNDFLVDLELKTTKSGDLREVWSLEKYPLNQDYPEPISDSYLVNFKNENGYAVLAVDSIDSKVIALVESGNSTWDKILCPQCDDTINTSFEDEFQKSGISPDRLVTMCVRGALFSKELEDEVSESQTKTSSYDVEVLPLTSNMDFGQIVTYCHKSNRGFVTCGCAATALAIICAKNTYPILNIDGSGINYNYCNTLDGSGVEYGFDSDVVNLQLSDYFYNYGAFQLPAAVEDAMETLNYENVEKIKKSSLTSNQIQRITSMLLAGKPVLMCGWSLFHLSDSHYWVVDGIRRVYSSGDSWIHCNWGWHGHNNGWFSTECLHRDAGISYDDGTPPNTNQTDNEWGNIIVYTYDMNATKPILHYIHCSNYKSTC